jgi:predicted membrane protein
VKFAVGVVAGTAVVGSSLALQVTSAWAGSQHIIITTALTDRVLRGGFMGLSY